MATSRKTPVHGLTDYKLSFLPAVAHLQLCTAKQLSDFTAVSEKAMRDHCSDLYRHGMLDSTRRAVTVGTSPLIYTLSKQGAKRLNVPFFPCPSPAMLLHELEVRDFRVWLEVLRRTYSHDPLMLWKTGTEAFIGGVRPDAVFVYPFKGVKLTGMVEIDRSTETRPKVWQEKGEMYARMMRSGDLKTAIGQDRGRVLVVTPDGRRRDEIARILTGTVQTTRTERDRFWVTAKSTLERMDLTEAVWRVPEDEELRPLVPDGVV